MRKFTQKVAFALIALLCMIAVPQAVMAQTCVEIGDGTDSKNQLPICGYYHSSYTQQLYLASELGISAGNITSIAFQYTNATSTKRVISIFMANTDAASLSNAYVTDAEFTEVLSQSVVEFDNSNDWFVIDLETPFAYDGSSNLLVTVYMSYSAEETHYNSDNRFAYTSATGMARYTTNDNTSSATELTVVNGVLTGNTSTYTGINGTSFSYRPNMQFCYTTAGGGPTCDKPELVEANDVTANSATINWTGSASTYNLQYKVSSDQEWTLVKNLSGNSYQLSNLVSNTAYQVQVQAVCGENTSGWKSVSFRTLIDLPFAENFNSSSLPEGWGRYTGTLNDDGSATLSTTTSYWTFGTNCGVFDSHAHMEVYSTYNAWLVTPTIPIPALEEGDPGYHMLFNLALTYWSGTNVPAPVSQPGAHLYVLASLDGGNNWTTLREWNNTGSEYVFDEITCSAVGEEVDLDLSDYAGNTVQLAFYLSTSGSGDNRIHIDNLLVEKMPTCLKPTNLHEVEGQATSSTLPVAWTANSEESAWHLQYKAAADTAAEWITLDINANPYTITGLEAFTEYEIRVAAVCSAEDFTDYGKSIFAKTAAVVPFAQSFDTTAMPVDWKRYEVLLEDLQNSGEPMVASQNGWKVGAQNGVFSNEHLYLNIAGADTKHWLVGPMIEMQEGYQLTFDLALTTKAGSTPTAVTAGEQNDDMFIVLISTDGGEEWTALGTWGNQGQGTSFDGISTEGQTVKFDLSEYADNRIMLAFYGESTETNGDNNLHISNVKIDLIPACERPLSITIGGVTSSSAQVTWDADEDGQWEYGYVANPASDFAPAETDYTGSTNEKIADLSGLQETTDYVFFVRRACSETEKSEPLIKTFKTSQTPAAVPYEGTFEETNGWLSFHGGFANEWVRGTAVAKTGTHALYISNDNGTTAAYTHVSCVVYATKTFYFEEAGLYSFSFDWLCKGESSYDYVRVALIPSSVEVEASTTAPSGLSSTALPNGWTALDGGSKLNGVTTWQTQRTELNVEQVGYYKVVLVWKNDGSGGTAPGGAIDNFKISKLSCRMPSGLTVSDITANEASFAWNDDEDGMTWEYACVPAGATPAEFTDVAQNTLFLDNLAENTNYTFYLRKDCGDSQSESIEVTFKTVNPYQIIVNEGTSTNSNIPFNTFYVDAHTGSQFITPAERLSDIQWDSITALTFYSSVNEKDFGTARFDVYVGEVAETTMSAYVPFTSLTKVASNIGLAVEENMMYVEFDSAYCYHGGNLLVAFDQIEAGSYISSSWQGVSASSGAARYEYGVNGPYSTSFLPKMSIDFKPGQAPACSTPKNFMAIDSLTTTTSVKLEWIPVSPETNWVVRYRAAGTEEWIVVLSDQTSLLLEGLTPSTLYEAQVATQCDPADPTAIGEYSRSISFATLCEIYSIAEKGDFIEGFEAYQGVAYDVQGVAPICWETGGTTTYAAPHVVKSGTYAYVHEGNNALNFCASSSSYAYAVLPEFADSLKHLQISFWAKMENATNGTLYVGYVDSAATFHELITYTNNTTMTYYESNLSAMPDEAKYLAFVWENAGSSYYSCCIDDIKVSFIPSCIKPENVAVIDSLTTPTTVTLTWEAQGAESAWNVEYKHVNDSVWSSVVADNDTILLEGLIPASYYDVRVAAICSVADTSDYTLPVQFVTDCAIISEFPYAENFDAITGSTYSHVLPICWSFINTCTYSSYKYYPTVNTAHELYFRSVYELYDEYYDEYFIADPQDQYAILPQIEGISGLRMRFNARKYSSYNSGDSIVVGIMTDPQDTATFEPIQVIKPAATTYEPFEVRFNNYAGAGQYIAIMMQAASATATSRGLYIDDIVVEELPNCLEPEGLAVFDIKDNSAKFTWTVEEGESYVYAVAFASAGEPAEEAFAAATDSMQVSGLVDNKDYILYLRRNCAGNYSPSISAAFHTLMVPATAPFADDFEAGNNWMFINGSLTNAWAYGEAAHNDEGTHAIYISNDGGATNAYTNTANAVVYAVKSFNFEEGVYTFKYDWKAKGEGTSTMYDYLRVFIVPESVELVPGTSLPTGLTATALPAAWNAIALDGGSAMNGVTSWQTFQTTDIAISAGAYKVVFLWKNDGSGGTNPPAAIDNFSISKITCLPVSELAVSGITSSSATIAWTAPEGQEAWQLAYSADPNFDIAEATLIDVASTQYALADLLTDTLYNVYVRANCGSEDGVSVWSQISFRTAKSCQTPDDLVATPGLNTAEISWNTYGQTGFNLRYIHGTDTVLVPNVESPYELTGLDANTLYQVQVQAACESEDSWSAAINFRTDCGIWSIATDGRYVEDFESYAGTAYNVYNNQLNCWTMGGNATCLPHVANSGSYGYYPHSGTKALSFYGSANSVSYAVLPQFAEDLNGLQISFWAKAESASYGTMSLGYMTADSVFHQLTTVPCTTTETKYEYILDTVPAVAGRLAFCWVYAGTSYFTAGIDDIEVGFIPTCLAPKAVAASDIFAHSAKISWTNGAEGQDAWQIAINTLPTNRPDTLLNITDVTENPYVLSGLDPETRYYVYVRANCGAGDFSKFSDGINFKTTIACPAPSALKATITPGNGSIATLSWSAGAEENAWVVEYSLNADLSDSIEVLAYETFVNLTDLTAEQTYYARVKADCGELDGESLYSAIISFKPTDLYEIIVNDGTNTNAYVPVYGAYVDAGTTASQFIVPAAELQEIMWDSITKLTFYATQDTSKWGASEFEVYMTTTEEATLGALVDWNSLTQVMVSGNLSIVDNKMEVTLSEPFHYTGDNLLIGFKQTAASGSSELYSTSTWYGKNTTGASIGGYGTGNNMTQRNFSPKMTINYVPGQAPACMWATHLEVSNITTAGATFSWDEVEGANWEYAVVLASSDEAPTTFAPATKPLVLDTLSEATAYVFYLRNNCGDENSKLVSLAFSTIEEIESLPYSTSFADAAGWKLANDANAWIISDGNLFISNDGVNYGYDEDAPSVSFVTKLFDFNASGTYTVSYDWKCVGEYDEQDGAIDFMRAALVPADVVLTAGVAPEGLTAENLPAGWIAIDENAALVNQEDWQHKSVVVPVNGMYRVVFVWINDDSFSNGVPAAIDNLSIVHKNYPTDIEGTGANSVQAIKFIENDHVYILVNGVVYDLTGRKVNVK